MKKKIIISFAIIISIILLSVIIFLFSGRYSVNKFTVLGQTNITKDKIIKLANIDINKNIYLIDIKQIEENLKKDKYIESAVVRRKFPREITISIVERTPVGSIPITGGYAIIDDNAVAINIVQNEKKIVKPMISGIKIENVKIGDPIKAKNKEELEDILKIIKLTSSLDLLNNISYIDLKTLDNISMTTKTGILVKFGSAENMQYKVKLLNKILIDLSTKGKTKGTIDMSYNTDPIFYE